MEEKKEEVIKVGVFNTTKEKVDEKGVELKEFVNDNKYEDILRGFGNFFIVMAVLALVAILFAVGSSKTPGTIEIISMICFALAFSTLWALFNVIANISMSLKKLVWHFEEKEDIK